MNDVDPSSRAFSSEAFAALGAPDLVYVRPVRAAEIRADAPSRQTRRLAVEPQQTPYAVCRADGLRLAVMGDKETALALALAHRLEPVWVH